MRERSLLVRSRRLRARRRRMGPRGSGTKSDLANGYDQDLGRTSSWMGVSGERDRLLHEEMWMESSHRCRTRKRSLRWASGADRLPAGSRENDLT
jgi:hypothetical protein